MLQRLRVLLLSVTAAGLLAGTSSMHAASAATRSNKDYCVAQGASVVFAIDITTPYDEHDRDLLVRAVQDVFGQLRGGDRVVIRTISEASTTSERLLDRCMPYCEAASTWEAIFKCNEGMVLNDTRHVRNELAQALRSRLANFTAQPRSDIIRTLVAISREELRSGGRKTLYVFSDMIENSDHISGRVFFTTETQRLLRYLVKNNLLSKLDGTDVRVFGVGRDGTAERAPLNVAAANKIRDFWQAYFRASKAQSVEISQNYVEFSGR